MTSSKIGGHGTLLYRSQVHGVMTIVLLIVTSGRWASVDSSAEMFTSLADVQRALDEELSATQLLRQYISVERQRIDQLQRLSDEWEAQSQTVASNIERLSEEWEAHSKTVASNIERFVFHPVNYFLLAKHYAIDCQKALKSYISQSNADELLSRLKLTTVNFPGNGAFEMSASALLRLQDVYNIPTDTISSGRIGDNSSPPMSADDCFQLGKVAYDNNDFYHALTWLNEALRIGDMEIEKTTSRIVVLDYLSFALYKQGNVRHAYNLTMEWLQQDCSMPEGPRNDLAMRCRLIKSPQTTEPNHERAKNNVRHYLRLMAQEEEQLRQERRVVVTDKSIVNVRNLDSFRDTEEFAAYEKLCRGENTTNLVAVPPRRDLTCQYRRHVPMFYIRPLKEELVSLQPRIVVYHDVISDSEIEKIKQVATPKLHRSGVFALKTADGNTAREPGYTEYRTSKSAWLNDVEHPIIARISRRAAAVSNLTLDTVEDLQVLNYGIGGHYEPHYDFSRADELAQFTEAQGNRIATLILYLNDVNYGGFTVFNVLGISLPTSKGSCLLWYNLLSNGEGDYRTRHAGCPVLVGTKWVANKWFHYGGQEFSRPCGLNPSQTE